MEFHFYLKVDFEKISIDGKKKFRYNILISTKRLFIDITFNPWHSWGSLKELSNDDAMDRYSIIHVGFLWFYLHCMERYLPLIVKPCF